MKKNLISTLYRELLKSRKRKTGNLIEKWAKYTSRQLTKNYYVAHRHMKRCSRS